MPTLHGTMPYDGGEERPCVWCRTPTDLRFLPEGMPQLGPQPLHITCGIDLIRAYERWREGMTLSTGDRRRLGALSHATSVPVVTE